MNREPTASASIASLGYDADAEILEVEFRENGHVYQYFRVPESVYGQLMTADSMGRFFNKYIRDGYACAQL